MSKLLFKAGDPYTRQAMLDTYEALEELALNDLGLSIFPNQIQVIDGMEMLDCYNGVGGMPIMYNHWSFGLQHMKMKRAFNNGDMGLAYELVIGSNPCISYNMASNGMAMMALVMAHAAFGHNHVFKNNYLFKKHSHPEGMIDYALFAQEFIAQAEREYGVDAVEETLDAAHSLMLPGGVFRSGEPPRFDAKEERKRHAERMRYRESQLDATLLATVPGISQSLANQGGELIKEASLFPQENILYFLEKHSPTLEPWQREILRIVRTFAQQILFPMVQCKVVHEGAATFCHRYLLQKLHEQGRIDDGTWMKVIQSTTDVINQGRMRRRSNERLDVDLAPGASHNPYALGYAICEDIVRISTNPTGEDRKHFKWAGKGNWRDVLKDAWANYRDESFIMQFLSPKVVKDLRLIQVQDQTRHVEVQTIHNEDGFERLRQHLGRLHSFDAMFPRVEVADADFKGDRALALQYYPYNGMKLTNKQGQKDMDGVLYYVSQLWGLDYEVQMIES